MEPQEFEHEPPTILVEGPNGPERRRIAYYDTELDGPFKAVPVTGHDERAVQLVAGGWLIVAGVPR